MDLSIGGYANGLSAAYRDVLSKPLYFEQAVVSKEQKEQHNASKITFSDEVKDNLSYSYDPGVIETAIKTGARNITDYINLQGSNIEFNINAIEFMLGSTATGARSLFDMSKLYEDEYNRVKGLTDITESERELRLRVLDEGFLRVSQFSYSFIAANVSNIGRSFNDLIEFTENATKNIKVSGLSERTQALMMKSLHGGVAFYKNNLMNQAIRKGMEEYARLKGGKLTPSQEEFEAIVEMQYKKHKDYLDRLRILLNPQLDQLNWKSNVVSNQNANVEEDVDKETSSEVSSSEDSSEEDVYAETSPENFTKT